MPSSCFWTPWAHTTAPQTSVKSRAASLPGFGSCTSVRFVLTKGLSALCSRPSPILGPLRCWSPSLPAVAPSCANGGDPFYTRVFRGGLGASRLHGRTNSRLLQARSRTVQSTPSENDDRKIQRPSTGCYRPGGPRLSRVRVRVRRLPEPGTRAQQILEQHLDDFVLVSDDEIRSALDAHLSTGADRRRRWTPT